MKNIFLLSMIMNLQFFASTIAQPANDYLNINNVNARLNVAYSLFWDLTFGAKYEVPKGSGKSTIFSNGIWIGGLDPGGSLHLAGEMYSTNGSDYWPGPLDANGQIDQVTSANWNQIWKVHKMEIDAFLTDLNDNGVINNTIPQSILKWPAKNNPNLSIAGNQDLAPFVDTDGNGSYNPSAGDYPLMKGDQMLWWVFNDAKTHTESGGQPLKVEIQACAYAYNQFTDPLNKTIYLNYTIISKSTTQYDSLYVGIFTDFDLGDPFDDFVGCNPALNSFYAYNGDAVDGPTTPNYGNQPPIQTVTFLNQALASFMYFDNMNGVPTGNPSIAVDYYNYLNHTWEDGIPVTYGGTGYDPASTFYTNYMFPSDPSLVGGNAWSRCSENMVPQDTRGIGSTGPFTLNPGEKIVLDVAYITHFPPIGSYPCPALTQVTQDINYVKNHYQTTIGVPIQKSMELERNIQVYPNPSNNIVYLDLNGLEAEQIIVTDVLGRQVYANSVSSGFLQIPTEDWKEGMYFVSVRSAKEKWVRKINIVH